MFQVELKKSLDKTPYPAELVHSDFAHWMAQALRFETDHTLQCGWATFREMLTKDPKTFNMSEMGSACNAIAQRNMHEMDMTTEAYIVMRDELNNMVTRWNEMIKPIRAQVERRVAAISTIQPVGGAIFNGNRGRA